MSREIKIKLGLIVFLVVLCTSLILSREASPNNPFLFSVKRVQEKAFLALHFSKQGKLDYMSSMLNDRLGELSTVVNKQSYSYVLPAASRYSTLAGEITDYILANNLKDESSLITDQFNKHQKLLRDLYVIYPKNTTNVEYKYIEDDFNYLKIYIDKLSA